MSSIVRLTRKKPAFFLCDIQERFRSNIHLFPAVVHTAKKMLDAARILECPIIATEQYPKELSVEDAQVFDTKTRFSMVTEKVSTTLERLKTDSAVLFGIETALDLRQMGIDVFVVADGVSSGNRGEIPIALERMRRIGCVVSTSDSLLFEIMGDAKHPKFKDVSALIKNCMNNETHNQLLFGTSAI